MKNLLATITTIFLTSGFILAEIPTAVDFGNIDVDQTAEKTITFYNRGDLPLVISNISQSEQNSDFTISGETSLTINAGDSSVATLSFNPTSAGTKSSTLIVESNDPDNNSVSIDLSGTAQATNIIVSASTQAEGYIGDTLLIPVTIAELNTEDNVTSANFTISYNSSLINIFDIATSGTITADAMVFANTNENNKITIGMFSTSPITSNNETLVYLKTELLAEADAVLTFDNFIFNTGTPEVETNSGSISILSNVAPVFVNAVETATVNENSELLINYNVQDINTEDVLTFTAVSIPVGATFDNTDTTLTWTPDYTDAGTYTAIISVNDGLETVYDTTTITVNNVNRTPQFTSTLSDTNIIINNDFTLNYGATDLDEEELAYTLVEGPATATINESGHFSWTASDTGSTTLIVSVTDGIDTVFDTTIVSVFVLGDANLDYLTDIMYFSSDASVVMQSVVGATTLNSDALYTSDVTGDDIVGAMDASYILRYSVGLISEFPAQTNGMAKEVLAYGNIDWNLEMNNDTYTLPIDLTGRTENVYSVEINTDIDVNIAEINGITSNLPNGWQMTSNEVNGKIIIAMAGTTPLETSRLATIELNLLDKNKTLVVDGQVKINSNNSKDMTTVELTQIPTEFSLEQNYPNPFNPSTTIAYNVGKESNVNIQIFNILGKKVRTLVNDKKIAGNYNVKFNGLNDNGKILPTGTYIYRISAGSYNETKMMAFIK